MENRTKILGINKKIVLLVHKIMLVAMLHNTLVAPAQVMINDYFNPNHPVLPITNTIGASDSVTKQTTTSTLQNKSVASIQQANNKTTIVPVVTAVANQFLFHADIAEGVIGKSAVSRLDDASDNLFTFNVSALPNGNIKAFLSYDLNGVSSKEGVARSINDRYSTGGYLVKKQNGWTSQKEEIDIQWLNEGENKVLFSIPKGADYQYQIKNVTLSFENTTSESLPSFVVSNPQLTYEKDNQIYVKGFVRHADPSLKIEAENTSLIVKDGEFEGFIPLNSELKNRKFLIVKATDSKGLIGQELLSFDFLIEADKSYPIEITNEKSSSLCKANLGNKLTLDGASISIGENAISNDTEVSILKLRNIDIAPMGSGMINVTKEGKAYRFLPDGIMFDKPVSITIGYDEKLIPPGYSAKDIKTFYFNTKSKSWVVVTQDTINEKEKSITAITDHFTDYINGIIQTPESPETAGFTPTMMNDIKAADPSSEMTIISPPEVSQKGDASVSYPIKIPAGRRGLQPQLAVQYNNEGSNGWLGQGWSISIPAISIDTRWGTPLLDQTNESEIYSLNGEQLMYPNIDGEYWMPNRHYDVAGSSGVYNTAPRARITNAEFTPRKQGSFAKIIRHGNATSNYYWEVISTDGTRSWYGGKTQVEPNAVIKNANGHVVHWGLYMIEDVHGNNVKYVYNNSVINGQSGINANLNGGKIFQIKQIYYTGYNGSNGNYLVEFKTQNTVRDDVNINARLGVKQVDPYFLEDIIVKKTGSGINIRKYNFKYSYGKFHKGRLEAVIELDKNDNEFYKHTFEYYDDLNQGGTDVYFSAGVTQTICNDVPPPPCPDNDGDGVCNSADSCIDQPGPASNNGCPEVCMQTSFGIPTNLLYRYTMNPSYHGVTGTNFYGTNCFVASSRINSFTVDGNTVNVLPNCILLAHGQGCDPTFSLCPSTPLSSSTQQSVKNLEYDSKVNNYLFQLNHPIFNPQIVSYAYQTLQNNKAHQVSGHGFHFFSTNLLNLSIQYQYQGIQYWDGTAVWGQIFNNFPQAISLNVTNINSQIVINGSILLGTYDLNNAAQFSQFQSDLASLYSGTTASLSGNTVSINTNNPNLQSITVQPVSSNVSNNYTFTPCLPNGGRSEVTKNDWANLNLSKTEIEYGINRYIADGNELTKPIEDVKLHTVMDLTNNGKDSSISGVFTLYQDKNNVVWKNEKDEIITDTSILSKLQNIYDVNLEERFNAENTLSQNREMELRKEAQQKAINWLQNYYNDKNANSKVASTHKKDAFNPIVSFAKGGNSYKTNFTDYFNQLVNNYSLSFSGTPFDTSCPPVFNWDFLLNANLPSFNSTGAILGSTKSKSFTIGGHLGIGIDFGWDPTSKNITIGGGYNHSWDDSESLTALIDINGDGLDDQVIKQNDQLYWKKHTVTRTYDVNNEPIITHSFNYPMGLITSMNNEISDFYKSDGESSNWNIQVNFGFSGGGAFAGWDSSTNNSRTNIYFTDANGDGLMDIVKYGTVYFNRIDSSGNPYFEPESLHTENMLVEAEPVTVTPPAEVVDTETPNFDVVKVWEAPADGTIQIENTIVNTDPTKETVVTVEMQKNVPKCYAVSFPTPRYNTKIYSLFNGFGSNNSVSNHCKAMKFSRLINNQTNFFPTQNIFLCNGNTQGIVNNCIDNTTLQTLYTLPNTYQGLFNSDFQSQALNFINSTNSTLTQTYIQPNSFDYSCYQTYNPNYNQHYYFTHTYSWNYITTLPNINLQSEAIYYLLNYNNSETSEIRNSNLISTTQNYLSTLFSLDNSLISPLPFFTSNANSFNTFKNYFEQNYPNATVTQNNDGSMITITLNETGQIFNTLTISASNNSTTNTYNFEEVDCSSLKNNSTIASSEDWKNYKPSQKELQLNYNEYIGSEKYLNSPINKNEVDYELQLDEDFSVRFAQKNNYFIYNNNYSKVTDDLIISKLTEKYSVKIAKEYNSFLEEYTTNEYQNKVKRYNEAQAWLDDYYAKEKEYTNQSSNSTTSRLINPATCNHIPSELCLLFGTKLNSSNTTVTNLLTTDCDGANLTIKKGDRIYFRVHSVANGNPKVEWNPKVTYTDTALQAITDQNGIQPYVSSYSDGFILSQVVPVVFPGNGTAQITWDPVTVSNPTDHLTYEIIQRVSSGGTNNDTVIFSAVCPANATTTVNPSGLNSIAVSGTTNATVTQFLFRVRSTSNVNWKAVEWRPKMVCTTTQDVTATQGGTSQGSVTTAETKYPIVDYDIYSPYLCGSGYQTIDISQMNGGNNLSIAPTLTSANFNSNDNGILYFVVKRNNTLVGKRTITVINGSATVSAGGPIALGTGAANLIEVGYFTDDTKKALNHPTDVSLLQRVLSASNVATITNGSSSFTITNSQVNLMHEPLSLYGPMYRQWGQFMYNPAKANGATPIAALGVNLIKEELLTFTADQADSLQTALNSSNLTALQNVDMTNPNAASLIQSTLQNIQTQSGFNNYPFMTANPSRDFENGEFVEKWIGMHQESYAAPFESRAATFAQSFSFQDDSTTSQGSFLTGAYAIDRLSRGGGQSVSGGGSFGVVGASGTQSLGGTSRSLTDYIDLNGDRYPDIVTEEQVQYTRKTGGLFTPTWRSIFGEMSADDSGNWGVSASGTFSKSGKPIPGAVEPCPNGKLMIGKPARSTFGSGNNSAGISGNLGFGNTNTTRLWADLTGDGLPDILTVNGSVVNVQINLGDNTFNQNNNWGSFILADGNSETIGGGLGFNYANASIEAGVSIGSTDSDTNNTLIDMNGDGLLDKVSSTDSQISFDFNRGNQFSSSPIAIDNPFNFANSAQTTTMGINGTGTFALIWPLYLIVTVIPLKIPDVSVTASGSTSTNRTQKTISDFDGDGFNDLIEEISSNTVRVYHSRIRRTDLLKTVHNPLGGSFTIDYKVQPNDYGNPHAKWAMSSLVINDGYNHINDGQDQYRKDFAYKNGKYDRRERDFYGYEEVRVIDYNVDDDNNPTTVYRTNVSKYHNNSYFLNGLMKESYVIQGDDETKKFSRTINSYEVRELAENNTELTSTVLPNTFDVGGSEGRRTAGVVLTSIINELYELETSPQLTSKEEMTYDAKGNVIKYMNFGDLSNPDDDYSTSIEYHGDTALNTNNQVRIPKLIKLQSNSGTYRERETTVDVAVGTISSIKAKIDDSTFATSSMKYDSYGNLVYIEYPANLNGEAMSYKYTYDTMHHKYVVAIKDAFNYTSTASYNDTIDKPSSTTDLSGNQMMYKYDNFGRTQIIMAPKEIASGDPYTIKFEYFTKLTDLPSGSGVTASNFVPVALTYHYDTQHPDNAIETYTFIDGLARPIQVKKDIYINTTEDPDNTNYVEALSFSGKAKNDAFGRTIEQFHPYYEIKQMNTKFVLNEYDSSISSTTDYDELDRPTKVTDPAGHLTVMEYKIEPDVDGTMAIKTKTIVDQNGNDAIETETYKDISGKVISTMNLGDSAIWTRFNYNNIGELVSYVDDEGLTTKYTYDNLGRKIDISHPDNGTTVFKYDNANNLIQLTTANLATTGEYVAYNYEYNRLKSVKYPNNPDGTPNISNVTYSYGPSTLTAPNNNDRGKLIQQTDASGMQIFKYGNMGEMIENQRTVVSPSLSTPIRVFKTEFLYDSWNRLQTMVYPDGEKVRFDYDLGGNLTRMSGTVNSQPYNYIDHIDYDYYEQRTFLLYGNKTKTYYSYSPELRRLDNLAVKTADDNYLYNNKYDYDFVGNVLALQNNAAPSSNGMGGNYVHEFEYDKLNRLNKATGSFTGDMTQAAIGNDYYSDYSLTMQYNTTHGIAVKTQNHFKNSATFMPNTYDNNYTYIGGTHRLEKVTDSTTSTTEEFAYDENGNMIKKTSTTGAARDLLWDESNRLRVIYDNGTSLQHYIYDAGGERVFKANSDVTATYQNGTILDPATVTLNQYTTYPSAYIVIDNHGVYSKHYFAGSQRIVSRIGEQSVGIFDAPTDSMPRQSISSEDNFDAKQLQQTQLNDLNALLEKIQLGKAKFKEYQVLTYEKAEEITQEDAETEASRAPGIPIGEEPMYVPMYFYHPDHLGTSTSLTDANGKAYQFFLNLPFGETMAEQKGTMYYQSPYKFNGKELDEETGLYYYGARYYDPRISNWLSVDELMAKHPDENPYIYCGNNPIIFIDPDGKDRIYSSTGRLLEDTGTGNKILVRLGKKDVALSKLDYNKRGTLRAVSRIIAAEAGAMGYRGWFGVKKMESETTGAHTTSSKNRTVFFNTKKLQDGTYDNFYNLRSTLFHEADPQKGHRSEATGKPYTFTQHANVYLNQTKADDFYKSDTDNQNSAIVGFLARAFMARKEGEIGTNELNSMISDFNQFHEGHYYIDFKMNSGVDSSILKIYNYNDNTTVDGEVVKENMPVKPEE